MSNIKRTEILFLYDVQNANPNGDPSDENKPRIDEETGLNIVTDVRLKRTVRDYLFNFKGYDGSNDKDIFVRQTFMEEDPKKGLKDAKNRAKSFGNDYNAIIDKCIDIRLFGGVIPITKDEKKDSSITLTGPVQFKIGKSLHRVSLQHIKGTGAFASKPGADQNTFREEYILPYSFIAFYGIINENAAKHSKLSASDIEELKEALWFGTKNLITRSKFEHTPRLMLVLTHDKPNFFIGELDRHINLVSQISDESIRSIADFTLDFSSLTAKLNKLEVKPTIDLRKDDSLRITGMDI